MIFDRETKREKIIEGITREKELVGRKRGVFFSWRKPAPVNVEEEGGNAVKMTEDPIARAERQFYEEIDRIAKQRQEARQLTR